jgi:hypothetical protein
MQSRNVVIFLDYEKAEKIHKEAKKAV